MIGYLLDTNMVSDLVHDALGQTAQRLALLPRSEVVTSIVCAGEMRFGMAKSSSPGLRARVDRVLGELTVEPLKLPIDRVYARLRASPELIRQPLGANDLLIAAHALTLGCTLVSDDRAFERVPGLRVENWLA